MHYVPSKYLVGKHTDIPNRLAETEENTSAKDPQLNRLLKALTCKPMQQNEAELSVLPLPNQLLTETMPTY